MKKTICRWIAFAMLLLAIGFVWYALNHPEMGLPLPVPHDVMIALYLVYAALMIGLFIAPSLKRKREKEED